MLSLQKKRKSKLKQSKKEIKTKKIKKKFSMKERIRGIGITLPDERKNEIKIMKFSKNK